jgi:hypothetical protein
VQAQNPVALREWAAVCDAIGTGEQSLLLRTGGIHERAFADRERRVEHREFWLLPTYVHEAERHLVPAARDRLGAITAAAPPDGIARMQLHATVVDAVFVDDRRRLDALEPLHIYEPGYVRQRFDYRRPGLWAIVIRAHRVPRPIERVLDPEHQGCVSWVHFSAPLDRAGAVPVLDDPTFDERRASITRALAEHGS